MHQLYQRRMDAGLSKAELGRRVGCTPEMLYQIEHEIRKPGPLLALKLARELGGDPTALFPELAEVLEALRATAELGGG